MFRLGIVSKYSYIADLLHSHEYVRICLLGQPEKIGFNFFLELFGVFLICVF